MSVCECISEYKTPTKTMQFAYPLVVVEYIQVVELN